MGGEARWLNRLFRDDAWVRRRVVVLTIVVTLLIGLVVLGSRPGVETTAGERGDPGAATAISDTIMALFLAAVIGAGALLAVIFWPARWRRRKKGDDEFEAYVEPVRIHWAVKVAFVILPVLLMAGLIAAILTAGAGKSPRVPQAPIGGQAPSSMQPLATRAAVPPATAAGAAGWVAYTAASALLIVILAAGLWVFRRQRRAADDEATFPENAAPALAQDLAAAVDESLDDLRRERDPRRAVIAAYVRMERILARHGLARREVETPSEYAARILQELALSARALDGLTHLFELARFSRRDIDRSLQDQAIAALVAIREGL